MKRMLLATCFVLIGCQQREIPFGDHPGAQIYYGVTRSDVRCYRCHGPTGEGSSRAPALVKEGKTLPPPLFIKTVLEGRDRMPPFGSVLSEKEIGSIIEWLEKVNATPHGNG